MWDLAIASFLCCLCFEDFHFLLPIPLIVRTTYDTKFYQHQSQFSMLYNYRTPVKVTVSVHHPAAFIILTLCYIHTSAFSSSNLLKVNVHSKPFSFHISGRFFVICNYTA